MRQLPLAAARGMKIQGTLSVNMFDVSGKPTGFRDFPNMITLAYNATTTTNSIKSTGYENAGATLDSYSQLDDMTVTITFDQMNDRQLQQIFFQGVYAEVANDSTTITDELAIPILNRKVSLANRLIASITEATQPNYYLGSTFGFYQVGVTVPQLALVVSGNDTPFSINVVSPLVTINAATDSAGNAITTVTDMIEAVNADSSANVLLKGYLFAGEIGSSVVTPLTATDLADGVGSLVEGEDYTMDLVLGLLGVTESMSRVVENTPVLVSYVTEARVGGQIQMNQRSLFKGEVLFKGLSKVDGQREIHHLYQVNFAPNGELQIIGDAAFTTASLTCALEIPAGKSTPGTISTYA